MWLVTYYNINSWNHKCSEFETKKEAVRFAKERLEIQKEVSYLSGKVKLLPPDVNVEI